MIVIITIVVSEFGKLLLVTSATNERRYEGEREVLAIFFLTSLLNVKVQYIILQKMVKATNFLGPFLRGQFFQG